MKRILTAIVLIAAVLAILLLAPLWVLAAAAALVAMLAALEYRGIARESDVRIPLWWLALAVAASFYLTLPGIDREFQLPVLTLLAFVLFAWSGLRAPLDRVLPDTAFGVFSLAYIVYPLSVVPLIKAHRDLTDGDGTGFVLFLLVCVWAGDIAALYIGKAFGKTKLAPRLSPNKTVEGSIASIAGSLFFGLAFYFAGNALAGEGCAKLHIAIPAWEIALLAVALNLAAQLGDLLESAIKRGAGLKDSGSMLPGHGGILDRIDALLLAAPILWYWLLLKDWHGLSL